jgi:hypothetical protein
MDLRLHSVVRSRRMGGQQRQHRHASPGLLYPCGRTHLERVHASGASNPAFGNIHSARAYPRNEAGAHRRMHRCSGHAAHHPLLRGLFRSHRPFAFESGLGLAIPQLGNRRFSLGRRASRNAAARARAELNRHRRRIPGDHISLSFSGPNPAARRWESRNGFGKRHNVPLRVCIKEIPGAPGISFMTSGSA